MNLLVTCASLLEGQKGCDAVGINADHRIRGELVGHQPSVRSAGRDNQDVPLGNLDLSGPLRFRAGTAQAVAGTRWTALPVHDLSAEQHYALSLKHVINLR